MGQRLASVLLSALGAALAAIEAFLLSRLFADVSLAPLAAGFAALLPGAAVLAAMVLTQMGLRFVSGAIDPISVEGPRGLKLGQRVITNTVEQTLIFAPALLALAVLEAARAGTLVALGLVFALSRILFWAGYAIHPLGRAPGMGATVLVVLGSLAWALWAWLSRL
ncbi:MAG: MAPEG family protein [Elioraea sp.]|nr:MAPEG family protein [Elioraea sp.]